MGFILFWGFLVFFPIYKLGALELALGLRLQFHLQGRRAGIIYHTLLVFM